MRFTDRAIKALKPKDQRYEVSGNNHGLYMRISTSGTKTWVYMYKFYGRIRRMTLGTYPELSVADAHKAHAEARVLRKKNIDPATLKQEILKAEREAETITELAHEYLERHAKIKKRTWKEDQRILLGTANKRIKKHKNVADIWGHRKAKDITRKDVIRLLDDIVNRGAPITANRTLEVIRKMFNFAIERDILDSNPCIMVKAPGKKNRRDRVLCDSEITTFWSSLEDAESSEPIKLALKLQLVTAQRRGEVATAKWEDIQGSWWTIPASISKNQLSHRIPLSSLALDILEELKSYSGGSEYILPSPYGDSHILASAVTRMISRNRAVFNIPHFTPHDLRRTAASQMASMGISRLVIAKVLNHAENGITAVYDRHGYDAEKQHALDLWSDKLQTHISENQKKYSPLAQGDICFA